MKKFRTYKKHSLVYSLDKVDGAYRISIEKSSVSGTEQSTFFVNGVEKELKSLLCRLWSCGVTPMSLVYILEDEGYIPQTLYCEDKHTGKANHIIRRNQSCKGSILRSVISPKEEVKSFAVVGSFEGIDKT